ncbi:endonuclease/exonuclease/phosphatase family protein [Micromonospora sp. WMMD1102]|uniref:endonuclease/exonuclease/phosphatase family protein n=1 Tax=Micromonospora sp. WMMD1102 TaxID=3016105 RepID=UPI0024154B8A|nr:endonuclease/exonuclease/phosphatase family protein [Micromonospora sp. WMMD1102]MDG4784838.1 endonuclease/exonuclease/phosphatase family protein [Micromonospora sp. WMMD1102]
MLPDLDTSRPPSATPPPGPAGTAPAGAAPGVGGAGRWCLGTRLLVGGGLGWAVLLLLHALLSGRWWFWLLVETVPPILLLVVPLVLLGAVPLAARPVRAPMLVLLVATLLFGAPRSGLTPAAPLPDPATPPDAVRVFSWNPEYWDQDDDPDRFYAYLRAQRADVYLLQEYLHYTDRPVRIDALDRLRAEFPGYQVVVGSELVTLSRLPVLASRTVDASGWLSAADGSTPPPGTDWPEYWTSKTLRTDVRVGAAVVSFYNVHLAVQVEIDRSPLRADFYEFVRSQFNRRDAHLRALHADLAANPHRVLLSGDLNSTSLMRDLRRIGAGLRRHDPTAGSPLPASWPTRGVPLPRLWRLDWTFSRGALTVHEYRLTGDDGLSDHSAQQLAISVH